MTEDQAYLLESCNTYILPSVLRHDTWEDIVLCFSRLSKREGKNVPLRLFCAGNGGESYIGLAIVSLIQNYGKVQGILTGEALSTNTVIWAACQERYASEMSAIGLHPVALEGFPGRLDLPAAKSIEVSNRTVDEMYLDIYTSAAKVDRAWWHERYYAHRGYVSTIPAAELFAIRMAKPLPKLF